MKEKNLNHLTHCILLSLWMTLLAFDLSAQEYNYAYMPKMGSYTSTGSGTDEYPAINYWNEWYAGGLEDYTLGQIKATVTKHTSTKITFNISKTSGYFRNGNSGKIFILESYYGNVYATSFSISNSTTSSVSAYVTGYEDFEGTRTFDVLLITSDQQYKQYGGKITITGSRDVLPPTVQTGSVNNISAHSATFTGKVNPNGSYTEYYFKYGTSTAYMESTDVKTLSSSNGETSVKISVDGLSSNSHYYYQIVAENEGGTTRGSLNSFDTESAANNPPSIPTNLSPAHGAKNVETSGYFSWSSTDPEGDEISYVVYLGTSQSNMRIYDAGIGNSCYYELEPGQKYYWRVLVSDGDQTAESTYYFFTTKDSGSSGGSSDGSFTDCTSAEDCGSTNYGAEIYQAANYLANLGIVEGDNGYLRPDANVTRAQLAKMSLYSLYKGANKVPADLVSDHFPSIYPDLQDNSTYYYRPAKALLYLEYQDGVSPFDRNRSHFSPEGSIERNLVLKVICETFNIQPAESSSSNPFYDFLPS